MEMKDLYILRLWDGSDNLWIDVSKPVTKEEANRLYNQYTKNGTVNTCYKHFDYYRVFPMNTTMLFS